MRKQFLTFCFTAFASLAVTFSTLAGIAPPPNNALDFDGTDDNIVFNSLPSLSEATIETWINPRAVSQGGFNVILNYDSWAPGYLHFQLASGQVGFAINGNVPDGFTAGTIEAGTSYHLAVTYSVANKQAKIYIDGVLSATQNFTTAIPIATDVIARIGSWNGNDRQFDGQMDNFRIWNIVLSPLDIQANYNKTASGSLAGLVASYDFDQGNPGADNTSITKTDDRSINNFNGTLTGFGLNSSTSNFVSSLATVNGTFAFSTPSVTGITSNKPICSGLSTTMAITVAGTGNLTYSWYKQGVASSISGQNTATLNLTSAFTTSAGTYFAVVNGLGGTVTSSGLNLNLSSVPNIPFASVTSCIGTSISIAGNNIGWYADRNLTTSASSTNVLSLTSTLNDQMFYVAEKTDIVGALPNFVVNTYTASNFKIIDHEFLTDDDRGGVIVTKNHVYITGDNNTGRYDLDLNTTSGTQFPIHDGMFADLANGNLYELSLEGTLNTDIFDDATFPITLSGINQLDEDLNIIGTTSLTSPIIVTGKSDNGSPNGLYQGAGFIVFYEFDSKTWYTINIKTGQVANLGTSTGVNNGQSESWTDWGIAEFDGTNYFASYRKSGEANIVKQLLPDGNTTIVGTFDNLSDMASFTVDPRSNRWYFHFEGGSQFNGDEETLGYADATFGNTGITGYSIGCSNNLAISTNPLTTIATQPLATATVCSGIAQAYSVSATGANLSYLWSNGIAANTISTSIAGPNYMVTVSGTCGVVESSVASLVVNNCTPTGFNSPLSTSNFQLYPNPAQNQITVVGNLGSIEIYNYTGTIVYTGKDTTIDVSGFVNGLYVVKSGNSVLKFVKE